MVSAPLRIGNIDSDSAKEVEVSRPDGLADFPVTHPIGETHDVVGEPLTEFVGIGIVLHPCGVDCVEDDVEDAHIVLLLITLIYTANIVPNYQEMCSLLSISSNFFAMFFHST